MTHSERNPVYLCAADLKEGEMRGMKVQEQWILVVHHQNRYYLLDASCAHSGYALFKGTLNENGVITCPLHYAQFDCVTGSVVSDPAICPPQDIYEVLVEDGKVFWLR